MIALVQEHGGFVEFVRSCLNGGLLGIGKTGISLTSVESFGYNVEDRLVMELTTVGERNVYEVSVDTRRWSYCLVGGCRGSPWINIVRAEETSDLRIEKLFS